MQIEAAEVVACLFARHREAGGVDQADQVLGVDHEAVAETIGRHDRKVARGQHRQVELGASGDDLEPWIVARIAQLDLRALRQLADDLVERVGRRGNLARAFDTARRLVDDLHVEVGCRERHRVALGRQEHIGQDGDGVAPLDHVLHVSQGLEQSRAFDGKLHLDVRIPTAMAPMPPARSVFKGVGRVAENRSQGRGLSP